jgi:site-specific DNA recombinase
MSNLIHSNSGTAQPIRCAIYARYSSDVQKSTSIEDQVRNCREFAEQMGWVVLPEYIRSDEGISGAALDTRPAMLSLRDDAKKLPRPFDYILVDSTSRFGRELSDTLKLTKILKFHDVNLYFVTQRLDTKERYARKLQMVYGMQDEDFLEAHRENVHRGMRGIALKGYHTGGTHYGYKRILIYHLTDKDEHGRPAVDHVELEVDPLQAEIVLEIFTLRGQGYSLRDIAKHLNRKPIRGPRGRTWGTSTIKRIIKDELYRGIKKWDKKKNEMDPESYAMRRKPNPEIGWATTSLPKLRIISEELWEKVQEVNRNAKRFRRQLGGENRTANSRTYLFSGSLKCGLCLGSIGIIGGGSAGSRRTRYGCRAHRSQDTCTNDVTIRLDRLEDQLMGAILEKLQPSAIEQYLRTCQTRIEDYLAKESKAEKPDEQALRKRLDQLEKEQSNVAAAIASVGAVDPLLKELDRIETDKKEVKADLARANGPTPSGISFEEFRKFVWRASTDLDSILRGDRILAKAAIKRVARQLVLTPIDTAEGRFFEVSGDIDLFAGTSGVLLGTAVDRNAKQYTSLLSLTGIQLDPDKPAETSVTGGNGSEILAFPPPTSPVVESTGAEVPRAA